MNSRGMVNRGQRQPFFLPDVFSIDCIAVPLKRKRRGWPLGVYPLGIAVDELILVRP